MPSEKIIVDGVGIGGLKIRELLTPLSSRGSVIHNFIASFRPTVIALMIGSNDIGETDHAELLNLYLRLISELKSKYGNIKIVATQLLPRYGFAASANYNEKAWNFNQDLAAMTANDNSVTMKFVQFKFPWDLPKGKYLQNKRFFNNGGVHLTEAGYYRLFRDLRQIPINELKN